MPVTYAHAHSHTCQLSSDRMEPQPVLIQHIALCTGILFKTAFLNEVAFEKAQSNARPDVWLSLLLQWVHHAHSQAREICSLLTTLRAGARTPQAAVHSTSALLALLKPCSAQALICRQYRVPQPRKNPKVQSVVPVNLVNEISRAGPARVIHHTSHPAPVCGQHWTPDPAEPGALACLPWPPGGRRPGCIHISEWAASLCLAQPLSTRSALIPEASTAFMKGHMRSSK